MVKDQLVTDSYAIYCGDCMDVVPTLPESSVDLVIYSPPFCGLYNYSSDHRDFSTAKPWPVHPTVWVSNFRTRTGNKNRVSMPFTSRIFTIIPEGWLSGEVIRIHENRIWISQPDNDMEGAIKGSHENTGSIPDAQVYSWGCDKMFYRHAWLCSDI